MKKFTIFYKNKFVFLFFFLICLFFIISIFRNNPNLTYTFKMLYYNGINRIFETEVRKVSQNCKFSKNLKRKINFDKDFFFIAGHTYGSIYNQDEIIYPKFYSWLNSNKTKITRGFFVGDFIKNFNDANIEIFNKKISNLNFDTFYAPGNHEFDQENKRKLFKKYFGKTYYSYQHNKNLFIILNPYLNNWSIKNEQLFFLKKQIIKNKSNVRNIFLIFHPTIFFEKYNKKIRPNSYHGYEKSNFWNEIYPFLKNFKKNFYLISGDFGAYPNNKEFFCDKKENILFIGTGMGGGVNDNILVFQNQNNELIFEVVFF